MSGGIASYATAPLAVSSAGPAGVGGEEESGPGGAPSDSAAAPQCFSPVGDVPVCVLLI